MQRKGIWQYNQGKEGNKDAVQINFDTNEIILSAPHNDFQINLIGSYVFYGGTKMNALELARKLELTGIMPFRVNKWY